jgi:hypothetical protein
MNHRIARSPVAKVATTMRRDLDEAHAPLTRRQRLLEFLAVVAMVYLTIVVLAP